MAIQVWIVDGIEMAIEDIRCVHAFDTDISVELTRCSIFSEFSEMAFSTDHESWKAAVLRSFSGGISGTAMMVMESEEVVAWMSADGSRADIIGRFVDLGGRVLRGPVESARRLLGEPIELDDSHFVEDSLLGCLLATHAPSDTILIGSSLQIRSGNRLLDAQLRLALEPKAISSLLTALSVALH